MFHFSLHPSAKASRKDYLLYLILHFVATPEEQAEYRDIQRSFVEQYWNDEVERQLKLKEKEINRNIIHYKKMILELRSTLEGLEYANKYQELLNYTEKYRDIADSWSLVRGFASGWG